MGRDGHLITDDILKEFAVIGAPSTIAGQIKSRYGDLIDRTSAAYANIGAKIGRTSSKN